VAFNRAKIEAEIDALICENEEALIDTKSLADYLGLSAGRVQVLAREGIVPHIRPNLFHRRDAIRAYCGWVRQHHAGRGSASAALVAAKTRAAEATADKLELANQAARRELIAASEVERAWAGTLRDLRAGMLSVPSRVQQRMGHLTKHDILAIDAEIRTALSEAAHAE